MGLSLASEEHGELLDGPPNGQVRRAPLCAGAILSRLVLGALLVLGLNGAFAAAILLTDALVPNAALKERVLHFIAAGEITADNWPRDFTGHTLDRYSDCTAVSTNLVGPAGRSAVELLRDADVVGPLPDGREACAVLVQMANGAPLPVLNYFRYWHGYQILTKPLLLLVDLTTLRTTSGILYLVALAAFFVVTATGRHALFEGAYLALGFTLLTGAENPNGVMVHNLALLATFAGGILLHRVARRASPSRLFFAALVIAAGIGFIDENYVPPLAAMVLVLASISSRRQAGCESPRVLGETFAVVLFAWAAGYLGTMLLRVGLSALLLPDPWAGAKDFLVQLLFRMGGEVPWETHGVFAPILRNARYVVMNPVLPIFLIGTATVVAARLAAGWRFVQRRSASYYLLIAVLPLFWYMTFRNYSIIHAYFMYRWAAFSVVCGVGGLLTSLQPDRAAVAAPRLAGLTRPAVIDAEE